MRYELERKPTQQERKTSEMGATYWDDNAVYSKPYNIFYDKLVPASGQADTVQGELIRAISRLTYDYFNNGNCNVLCFQTEYEQETCYCCGGDGEIEVDYDEEEDEPIMEECRECWGSGYIEEEVECDPVIEDFYAEMIGFIRDVLIDNNYNYRLVYKLQDFLGDSSKGYGCYTFSDKESRVYTELADEIMFLCLNTVNKKL